MTIMPSPPMSVLKAYLSAQGYNVSIIYWNIILKKLEKEFIWGTYTNNKTIEFQDLLLLNNYLAIKHNDKEAYSRVKSALIAIKPQYLSLGSFNFDHHMSNYAEKLENLIDQELAKFDFNDILYWGFSVNLYQWIYSSIFAKKIKLIAPQSLIVIGGIGTKDSAIAFLDNFPQFDMALWGEGENSLNLLTKYLFGEINSIDIVPNIAFRGESNIMSYPAKNEYIDLDSIMIQPDFDDFYSYLRKYEEDVDVNLFIDGSRSCHWKQCKFCYLNTGYKHRLRNVEIIESNIRLLINKYGCMNYTFLDNDVIANNWTRFSHLLDSLIQIKEEYPDFQIILAEIITKGITENVIRRMALAGFIHVQIGYESASNTLLKKIHKKNTFASNLLFIKFALKYNIFVGGANVICGLLEETYTDVLEAIENIHFLRFYFQHGKFKHDMSRLGIMNSSRYYPSIKNEISSYIINESVDMLPKGYISMKTLSNCSIVERIVPIEKSNWGDFKLVEAYYLSSTFDYKLYKKEQSILYVESLNNEIINKLEIENSSNEYLILQKANSSVATFDEIKFALSKIERNKDITDCEIYNILEELKNEGLIYCPLDYSEVITIPDINDVI